jgi:hypothetical protein
MKRIIFFFVLFSTIGYPAPTTPPTPTAVTPVSSPAPVPPPVVAAPVTPAFVPVAAPAAPPVWAQDLLMTAEKLPVVGPILAKVLLWAGIIAGILTTLTGAVLGVVNTLMGVSNASGLTGLAAALANFRNGKVMYWLKFFSLFNAQKPVIPSVPTVKLS